jgi:Dyp-type peroxidase family
MDAACFLLLKIEEPSRARMWLRQTLPEVTSSEDKSSEQLSRWRTSLNLALTYNGLKALGLSGDTLAGFPAEFQEGMSTRADILGDTAASAPEAWEFGGTSGPRRQEELHLLLMLYGTTEAEVAALVTAHRARLEAGGLRELGAQRASRRRDAEGATVEHFGFRDGISQPQIEGFRETKSGAAEPGSVVKAGEFLLGYENEYEEIPGLPSEELGRNGSYLILRKLEQDVEGFHRFLEEHQSVAVGDTEAHKKQWLAAKLLGRWPNGAPLRPGEEVQPALDWRGGRGLDNSFGYQQKDAAGYGCPMASHVRRANPRDSLPPNEQSSLQVSRRHRLLRRGMTYSDETGKGMLFIALNANIARQFEFLQQTWLNNGKFGGRYDERDPLMPGGGGRMTLPGQPLRRCVEGLQSFVTMKGGGYFFLPSLKALEFLVTTPP